ncbi:condensation domain-containing protein [Streptomyces sp. enrichment culture]|uniref:condensation domain-containing protein n=1 Tax=Streptomyces sp. enrichment culture TaxID=1795815 RepID=UPI003F55F015
MNTPTTAPDTPTAGPSTGLTETLRSLFEETLGRSGIPDDASFFDLGGDSLAAMRLVTRSRSVPGLKLSIRTLFRNPSVAALAQALGGPAGPAPAQAAQAPVLGGLPCPERPPLSFGQEGLWYLALLGGPSPTYNVPVAVRLSGELDPAALEAALGDLVARHEPLRTVFPEVGGVPHQRVLPAEEARPVLHTLRCPRAGLAEAEAAAARHPFDILTAPPLRATLLTVEDEPGEHVLMLVMHHIVGDGWSVRPLVRDLGEAYAARLAGRAPQLPPLPVRYADFALWERESAARTLESRLAYWRPALAGLPDPLPLPTDLPRPAVASCRGAAQPLTVDAELTGRLKALGQETGATLFMVLQAALAVSLTRAGAGEDIPIGTPVSGRGHTDLDDLVGHFVNLLVLRTDTSGAPTPRELLARVRTADLEAYAHQDVPFDKLVGALNPRRTSAHHPLFQVALAFGGGAHQPVAMPGLRGRTDQAALSVAKFDLGLHLDEMPDGTIRGHLGYATDLFTEATARALAESFLGCLTELAAAPDTPLTAP